MTALNIETLNGHNIPWQKAAPNYLKYRLTHMVVGMGIVALILVAAWVFVAYLLPALGANTSPFLDWLSQTWIVQIIVAVFVLELVIETFVIFRYVRSLAYAEREDDILIRHGVLFRRMWAVPYGRIQSVEVRSGPLERAFGLAQLQIRTAGYYGQVNLPGISTEKADEFREELVARGQARLAGL